MIIGEVIGVDEVVWVGDTTKFGNLLSYSGKAFVFLVHASLVIYVSVQLSTLSKCHGL